MRLKEVNYAIGNWMVGVGVKALRFMGDGNNHLIVRGNTDFPDRAIIAANHVGYSDSALLARALREQDRRIYFLSKRKLMLLPFTGNRTFLSPSGKIRTENIRDMRGALEREYMIGIFPEGTISRVNGVVGQIGEIGDGVFKLSRILGAPIVPAAINHGTNERLPFESDDIVINFGEVFPYKMDDKGTDPASLLRIELQDLHDAVHR